MEHCHANVTGRVRRPGRALRVENKKDIKKTGHPVRFTKDLSRKRNWEMSN